MITINVQDSRLWDTVWKKMGVEEKLEALRETVFEITTELREINKENYDKLKSEFESDLELLEQRINARFEGLKMEPKVE